jgi:hypothetical protein
MSRSGTNPAPTTILKAARKGGLLWWVPDEEPALV